jgi:alpha-D-xyloside xylohydrolase
MKRRTFLAGAAAPAAVGALAAQNDPATPKLELVMPGIWRIRLGKPEAFTPVSSRRRPPAREALEKMPAAGACPIPAASITAKRMTRGFVVTLPLESFEMVYGLGLQLQSNWERGKKKTLRVNADPKMDSGDSHAPVPFYVTTRGYGVLVDTARYASFWCGGRTRKGESRKAAPEPLIADEALKPYVEKGFHAASQVIIDVPSAEGVELYIFAGPSLREAVARYNLFSGGGCVPTPAGLGVWYRASLDFRQDEVIAMASGLRESRIPCDVAGPGTGVADARLLVLVRVEQEVSCPERNGGGTRTPRLWGQSLGTRLHAPDLADLRCARTLLGRLRGFRRPGAGPDLAGSAEDLHRLSR